MNNIRIALIDTGMSKEYCERKQVKVRHFYVYKNEVIDGYREPTDNHADLCANMILHGDFSSFEIFDICVMSHQEEIDNYSLILGIKKAILEHVDIINLSLGCNVYSPELFAVCEEAVNNNIAVIAAGAHEGEIFYPADFKNVVCVKVGHLQSEEIKKIDDSTVSISDRNSGSVINSEPFSTSFASAFFSGVLGRLLNFSPFLDKFMLLQSSYGLILDNSTITAQKLIYNRCEIYRKLDGKKAAVVSTFCDEPSNFYKDLKLPNIVAYYDYKSGKFYGFNKPEDSKIEFDIILIINTLPYGIETVLPDDLMLRFPKHEILCLGKFKGWDSTTDLIYTHEKWNSNKLVSLKNPIIMVSGISCDFNKFDVSTKLAIKFKNNNIKTKVVTYNNEGVLYGFDIFDYPCKITFPDIVGSINNYMHSVESTQKIDLWIIDVGGGCSFINNKNRNNFGKLNEAYFHASNVDILLLCIDGFVDLIDLQNWKKKLHAFGINNIFFILSENAIDPTSWDSSEGLQTYKLGKENYQNCFDRLKLKLGDRLFSINDIERNRLYEAIVEEFGS